MSGNLALEPFLGEQGVLILDGGLATELETRGADLSDDLWSARLLLEDPASIRRLHFDYFEAGADVAISASYQASFEGFARRGLSRKQSVDLMQRSVHLAREARHQFLAATDLAEEANRRLPPLVAASVGSYGAFLADGSEYTGEFGLSKKALIDWHRPRMEALLGAEPDLLACETVPCLEEGEALVELLAEYGETPAWISFSCRDDERVCRGEPISRCVEIVNGSCSCRRGRVELYGARTRRGPIEKSAGDDAQGARLLSQQRCALERRSGRVGGRKRCRRFRRLRIDLEGRRRPADWRLLPHVARRHSQSAPVASRRLAAAATDRPVNKRSRPPAGPAPVIYRSSAVKKRQSTPPQQPPQQPVRRAA